MGAGESRRELPRAHESLRPNEIESLNSHQLSAALALVWPRLYERSDWLLKLEIFFSSLKPRTYKQSHGPHRGTTGEGVGWLTEKFCL